MYLSIVYECNELYTGSTNVLIDGMALTDPQFNKYPMLLSLLKFHSPHASNDNEKNATSSSTAVGVHPVNLSDNKDGETEVWIVDYTLGCNAV